MVIRKATSREIQKILAYSPVVMKESTMGFVEGSKDIASQMMSQILADGGYYLVYMEEKVVQGWVGIGQFYNSYSDEMEGMIAELYVLPQYRKTGIAERLLESAFNRLTEEGFKKVKLNVYSGSPAKYLYEKLGFHDVSTMMEKDFNENE